MRRDAVIFVTLLSTLAALSSRAGQPPVSVKYAETFDCLCSLVRGGQIQDQWKSELRALQPEFERLWNEVGAGLIAATETITGKTFPDDEVTVRLTLCDLPSQSWVGISINMRFALAGFTRSPVPLRYKVHTVFHELLHDFLAEHGIRQSALAAQYFSEPERVQDHLHLLALQKAVLLELGKDDVLREVIRIDSQLPDGHYKRAWEIVNATEARYQQFVAEIVE